MFQILLTCEDVFASFYKVRKAWQNRAIMQVRNKEYRFKKPRIALRYSESARMSVGALPTRTTLYRGTEHRRTA